MAELMTKGAVADHIEFLAAVLPDNLPTMLTKFTPERGFSDLRKGLASIRESLESSAYESCILLLDRAINAYRGDDPERGRDLLYDLLGILQGRSYRNIPNDR